MNSLQLYMLCGKRTKDLALKFLSELTPSRVSLTDEYPFPQYSDTPVYIVNKEEDILDIIFKNENIAYNLYWNVFSEINNTMLIFTVDGAMIAGISLNSILVNEILFIKLARLVDAKYGYITFELPPPDSIQEFIDICEISDQLKLVNGSVIQGL